MQRQRNLASASHAFFRDNKASIQEKTPYIALYFTASLNYCCLIISEKCVVTPNFLYGLALAKICFSHIVINHAKILQSVLVGTILKVEACCENAITFFPFFC